MISMLRLQEIGCDIIKNTIPENFQTLSYDLRIEKIIIVNGDSKRELDKYQLSPGSIVFVSTIEDICLPNNVVGTVVQRNSIIRRGLSVNAPVYLPGHHTKLFLRVQNLTQDDIELKKGDSIASLMFDELTNEVEPYKGKYTDEFNYIGVGDFASDIPRPVLIDKKIKNIEHIEKNLYEKVITILTIFVGIFSIINLNINFLSKDIGLLLMVVYNLMTIGGLGMMIGFVGFILDHKRRVPWIISTFSIFLIIIAIFLCFKG